MEKTSKVKLRAKDCEGLLTPSELRKGCRLKVDEADSKVTLYREGQKVCVWRECDWLRVSRELSELRRRGDL